MNKSSLLLAALCFGLVSCNSTDNPHQNRDVNGGTLADLALQPVTVEKSELRQLSLDELNDLYFGLIKDVNDPQVREKLTKRFAVLKMKATEQAQMESKGIFSYKNTIAELNELIELHPDSPANELLWYQLAKLYDLDGNSQLSLMAIEAVLSDFPTSEFAQEMEFRRAEIMFSRGDYYQAIAGYQKVLASPDAQSYHQTARYMLGWGYFKLEQNSKALTTFNQILDEHLPTQVVKQARTAQELLTEVPKTNKQMIKETFDIMSMVFANLNKPEAIAQHYQKIGSRPYEFLHYDFLGQYYLQKKRYSDSYAVYDWFVTQQPQHIAAAFYSLSKLEVLRQAKFISRLAQERVNFVLRYLPNSDYWQAATMVNQTDIGPQVRQMVLDLAQNAHAKAQQQKTVLLSKNKGSKLPSELIDYYQAAIDWYLLILANYPGDDKAREINFYLAESYYEIADYSHSAAIYQDVAYPALSKTIPQDRFAVEAAYGLILSLQKQLANTDKAQLATVTEQHLAAQNRFVDTFTNDNRRLSVLHQIFKQYFDRQMYAQAISKANFALTLGEEVGQTQQQKVSALFVIGDSYLRQQQYQRAEDYFTQIIKVIDGKSSYYNDVVELLSVSIFHQGEALLTAANQAMKMVQQQPKVDEQQLVEVLEQQQTALSHFFRLLTQVPHSTLAKKVADIVIGTEYDIATQYLNMKHWEEAEQRLLAFQHSYPDHKLAKGINTKLAFAYQESGQLNKAADILLMMWEKASELKDQKYAQQTKDYLWLAAGYYRDLNDKENAIATYRKYAHTYPLPFERSMEAKFIMSELYLESNEINKREFWLRKLIESEQKAGDNSSPRSRYLAAMSSVYFADQALESFKKVKLKLPLATSLKKKKALLDEAVRGYNNAAKYKVAQYTTLANFRLADVYRQLAADLIASDRPKGLSELELEQYNILLEEQAYPFEDQAIAVHEINAKRSYQGVYDQWVQQSFAELSKLLPARYLKQEAIVEVTDAVY